MITSALASADGGEAILTTLRAGDAFGELALIDGVARSATATAMEATTTLTLHRDRFRGVLEREPELRDAVLGALAARLRDLTDQLAELHFLDLAGRLGVCLVRLAERELVSSTSDRLGPIRLPATITQSDLAAMISGTRQRVNSALADLAEAGLVRIDGSVVTVLDLERLRARADW